MEIFKNAKLKLSESKGSRGLGIYIWGKNSFETRASRYKDRDNWARGSLTFPCRNLNSSRGYLTRPKAL